jgi:hypothetical protein
MSNFSAMFWRVNYDAHFIQDHHALLDFYSVSSLKQQCTGKHCALLEHMILILSQLAYGLTACLAEKQQILILWSLVRISTLEASMLTITPPTQFIFIWFQGMSL